MLPNNPRLFKSLTTVKLPWPTSRPGYMLFRSWMGFQTLVILQGQAPDTPTLLEAFLPQEAGSNVKKKIQTNKSLPRKWFMLNIETLVVYGLLGRASGGRKPVFFYVAAWRVKARNVFAVHKDVWSIFAYTCVCTVQRGVAVRFYTQSLCVATLCHLPIHPVWTFLYAWT